MRMRRATVADLPALSALMFVDPPREAVALARGEKPARRFQEELFRHAFDDAESVVFVAVGDDDEPVGFAWLASRDGSEIPSLRRVASMAVRAMGIRGALAAAWPASARLAVDITPPAGGTHVSELHVHPHHRGKGIGGALLDVVEDEARAAQAGHISLTTGSSNPARHLYERHGFEVMSERTGRRYARLTGIPARVLLVKQLRV
jgi:ribosomal protein S18 acetylase RimI-like enzyme